jgi:predicted MFS family arabinose efflux permease
VRDALFAAGVLNGVMLLASLAFFTVPVMGPTIAEDLGVQLALVGPYSAILWGSSIGTSVTAGYLIQRHGAFAMSQWLVATCALGLAMLATGWLPMFVVGAMLIGLAHGVETPASSAILARLTPPARQPLVFSLKQTGVQIGGIIAGATFPALALAFGWRGAIIGIAALLVAAAVALGVVRKRIDAGASGRPSLGFVQAFKVILGHPRLLRLSLASFAFVGAQVCLNTFLVALLVTDLGTSLLVAGGFLSAAQIGGLLGRLAWGAASGRLLSPGRLLAVIGAGIVVVYVLLGTLGSQLPVALLTALCFVGGFTASGWNGVFLAEVARLAPRDSVASITGASFLIGSAGLVLGPMLFSAVAARASFSAAFVALAGFALLGILALAWPGRR